MVWVGLALYVVGMPLTYWLTGRVLAFQMVCLEDRGRMSVVWPMTWLAALCTTLLIGIAMLHGRIVRRDPPAA